MGRWVVTAGGVAIIASIIGILAFILIEIWPLLCKARVTPGRTIPLSGPPLQALLTDEHRRFVVAVDAAGGLRILDTNDGSVTLQEPLDPGGGTLRVVEAKAYPAEGLITAATADGRVFFVRTHWDVSFEGRHRVTKPRVDAPISVALDPDGGPVYPHAARLTPEGEGILAAQRSDGTLLLMSRERKENFLTDEVTVSTERHEIPMARKLTGLVVDGSRRFLYAGTEDGRLLAWPLRGAVPGAPVKADAGRAAVTALDLLIGDRALVVGQADGRLSIWFRVPREEGGFRLGRIRDYPAQGAPIRWIARSLRNKGFLAMDEGGGLGLYYSTSHRTLWTGAAEVEAPDALTFAPKADGAFVAGRAAIRDFEIHNPHPEVSFQSLFGRVWYEGYEKPEFVWQSSSASDDFEPKLSLTPLLVGTLKGTLYSLSLAIPLAVLGAMYASQFMHPRLKGTVKPTIEIMAALPTVVLGFLAGLWLAPRLERVFPALILMIPVLPLLVLATGGLGRLIRGKMERPVPAGLELLPFMFSLAFGLWFCLQLSGPFEAWAFGGDFRTWLSRTTGLSYDQRNAVVIGISMGFAVIPIIFSISEEAFSNVPQTLVSGSLALGASRWQTVTRVVLPTASPGIFSAVMIGFGRAVGETMIVLMATGNTPIMDWSPFNGFRTLSANIAVEIPEAPQGDTLYRTLFLAALLLFMVTFAVNTAAEIVRQRLRSRYAQL
jgi:phosphate transport system permease protein